MKYARGHVSILHGTLAYGGVSESFRWISLATNIAIDELLSPAVGAGDERIHSWHAIDGGALLYWLGISGWKVSRRSARHPAPLADGS